MKKKALRRNWLGFVLLFLGMSIFLGCRDVSKTQLLEDIDAYVNTIDQVHLEVIR
jgi:hypothetical protein